jgi:hypothetical protein
MTRGEPFSSRHRIIDTAGATHQVLVVGDQVLDSRGTVVGSEGFYVDLTDFGDEFDLDAGVEANMEAAVAEFASYRACIEQAKGMLMQTYGIGADRAFDILVWRSQTTNIKLRDLAGRVVEDFTTGLEIAPSVRRAADHLLLTAHARLAGGHPDRRDDPADPNRVVPA